MGRLTFVLKGRGARGEGRGARRRKQGPVLDRPSSVYRSLAPGPRYRIVVPAVGPAPAPCLYPSRVLARSLARSLVHVHALTDTLVRSSSSARAVRAGAQSLAESPGCVDAGGFYSGDDAE